jgi:hypothetical protein
MAHVQMERPLSVPVVPARAAASSILREVSDEKGHWGDFALYSKLSSLGLPDVGYVAIPVKIDAVEESLEPRHEIRFRLFARRSKDAFPMFEGAIGIDGNGPSASTMWLAGDYEPPMKALGAMLDKFLTGRVAEHSLYNMLNELANAIEAKVERRELAEVRYRLIFNTGD